MYEVIGNLYSRPQPNSSNGLMGWTRDLPLRRTSPVSLSLAFT